ncbi:YqjF family protein [Streptomyces sp. NPDC059575]|uniref:YqjF family protein n=1 Tax=Streptomyces sp. NPDC059575 TaxID=3346872 RepID=UPI003684FB09
MVSCAAEERVRVPVMRARWRTLTFVHWPMDPEAVQALLPEELTVDRYDGTAWVTLTLFLMADVRLLGMPSALPALPDFPQTNLRTYVRHRGGRDGLWLFSVDVGCPAMWAARVIGAPYHPASVELRRSGDTVVYSGSRWTGGVRYRMAVRPGDPIELTERDHWLVSRWRAYTRRAGLLWENPVEHEPWPLNSATIEALEENLTAAAGLPAPLGEPVVHFSRPVRDVRLGVARPVRGAGRSRPAHPGRGA